MIWEIAKKEYLDNLLTLRFSISFLLFSALTVTCSVVLVSHYNEERLRYAGSQGIDETALRQLNTYGDLSRTGVDIQRPPEIMQIFVQGLERGATKSLHVSALTYPSFQADPGENPLFAVFQPVDYSFLFRIIFSLGALIFSFNAIAGEKEGGTLRLILANSVTRSQVLVGKLVGGFFNFITPVCFAFLLGVTVVVILIDTSPSLESWLRIGMFFGSGVLLLGAYFALGIFASTLAHRPIIALFLSFSIWVVLVIVVPHLSAMLSSHLKPIPTRADVLTRKQAIRQNTSSGIVQRIVQYIVKAEGPPSNEAITNAVSKAFEENNKDAAKLEAEYLAALSGQVGIAANLSRLSPSSTFQLAGMQLADTSFDSQRRFIIEARNYQEALIHFLLPVEDESVRMEHRLVPRFQHQGEPFAENVSRAAGDVILLVLFSVVLIVASLVAFSRYDAR